jgi:hypothetical protein
VRPKRQLLLRTPNQECIYIRAMCPRFVRSRRQLVDMRHARKRA